MKSIIFLLFLVSALSAQDCIDKGGKIESAQVVLAYSRDLSGIMATAKKEGDSKFLELYMFLPKKAAFDKYNAIEMVLTDSTIVTGVFAEDGRTRYSEDAGYHVINIKVFFPDEYLDIMTRVPVVRIKMRGNKEDVEMMSLGKPNKFMEILKCII